MSVHVYFNKQTLTIITISPRNPNPVHIHGENHNFKRYLNLSVHCSTIYNSQDMEATKMSINGGMDKDDVVCVCIYIYIYTHNGMLFSHKKEQNHAICRDVDGPRDCYTE